jgi:type I restriction enzyme S subunit
MSKQKTQTAVPKLRFPEFRDAGGWDYTKLSNVANVVMGSSPSSECYNQNQIGLPLLQGNADVKNRLSAPRIYTSDITKECAIGDILISVRAPVGTVAKSIHHACIGRGIAAIRSQQQNSQEFIYQWLLSYEPKWSNISQGATFDAVNSDDVRGLALAIPFPKEQQKIADCLSSVDELIAAEGQKLEALQDHKKGLMQELFPTEGQTLPNLRFPEFKDAPEWEEKSLGSICTNISSGKDKSSSNGSYDLYGSTGVIGKTSSAAYEGDFLLVARVGANAGLVNRAKGKFGVTDNTLVIHLQKDQNTDYISYVLEHFGLNQLVFGSGQPLVTGRQLKELAIALPLTQEHQRIADCLSSLDTLITAQSQKIEALQEHKKGLMQELFPTVSEVQE